jgi:hypothetical protein
MQSHKSKKKENNTKILVEKGPSKTQKDKKGLRRSLPSMEKTKRTKKEGIIANIGKPTISPLIKYFLAGLMVAPIRGSGVRDSASPAVCGYMKCSQTELHSLPLMGGK